MPFPKSELLGNPTIIWGTNPTTSWKQKHDTRETHLRRLEMKNRFPQQQLAILSKKLKLLRKVKGFQPSLTLFDENLIERGSV